MMWWRQRRRAAWHRSGSDAEDGTPRVGFANSGGLVFVDEAAEAIAAADTAAGGWLDLCGFGLSKCERAVGPVLVVGA
jgi:hypothetical protein